MLPGYGPTAGAAIASHMDIDKVAFTGSTEVGHLIMEAAGKVEPEACVSRTRRQEPEYRLRRCRYGPAVEGSHFALFFNQGQCCCAGSRVFVEDKVYDEFVERSIARAHKRKVGDPFAPIPSRVRRWTTSSSTKSWATSSRARRKARS